MRSIYKILLVLFFIPLAIYIYLNTLDYGDIVSRRVKEKSNLDISPKDVTVRILPYPTVYVRNVKGSETISADSLKMQLSIGGLLGFSSTIIDSVQAQNVIKVVDYESGLLSSLDNLRTHIREMSWFNHDIVLYNVDLVNSKTQNKIRVNKVLVEQNKITAEFKNSVKVICHMLSDDHVKVSLVHDGFNIDLDTKYDNEKAKTLEVSGTVKDLFAVLFPMHTHVDDGKDEQKRAEIALSGLITRDEDKMWTDEISIKSGFTNASSNFVMYFDNSQTSTFNLKINNTDLTRQISHEMFDYWFDMDSLNFKFNISGDSIQIYNNTLSNVICAGEIKDGMVTFKQLDGMINPEGSFRFTGNVEKSRNNHLLKGNIEISHPNINAIIKDLGLEEYATSEIVPVTITSNLIYSDIDTVLTDLFVKYKDMSAIGNVSIKLIGKEPRVNTALALLNVDFSQPYPILSHIYDYVADLGLNFESSDYVNKYTKIRNINHIGNYQIQINNSVMAGQNVEEVTLFSNIIKNFVNITSFYGRMKNNEVSGNLIIDAQNLKPNILLNITDARLANTDILSIFDTVVANHKNIDLNSFFAKGSLHINSISDTKLQNISNLNVVVENKGNIIEVSKFEGKLNDTSFNMQGNVSVNPFKLASSYLIESAPITSINKFFSDIAPIMSGLVNLTGTLETKGISFDEVVYYASLEGDFSGKEVEVSGMDMDGLVEDLRVNDYIDDGLTDRLYKASHEGSTVIKNISGKYKVSKGISNLSKIAFNTKNTAGTGEANVSLYSQDAKISSVINFYLLPVNPNIKEIPQSLEFEGFGKLFSVDKILKATPNLTAVIAKRIASRQQEQQKLQQQQQQQNNNQVPQQQDQNNNNIQTQQQPAVAPASPQTPAQNG